MRKLLVFAAFAAMAVVVAACTGDDDDDDVATSPTGSPTASPSPSPSPTSANFTLTGTGWPHNGMQAWVRVFQGTTVEWCAGSANIAGQTFTVTSANLLTSGVTYTWETFADLGGTADGYDGSATDHSWRGTFVAGTAATTITVPHADAQATLTWDLTTLCPGGTTSLAP